jgi:O-acetyl-ADP-ribose deacetylase (regulator of RNase III)
MDEFKIREARVRLVKGDITEMATDAIVNAANSTLMGGGGVDGAIHRKGGPKILEECLLIRQTQYPDGLPTGKAVITSGGNLKAKQVIHAVGPIWRGGKHGESDLLEQAYLNSMQLARGTGLRTLAFPSISTGAYGYPVEEASRIALGAVVKFLKIDGLSEIVFVLFSDLDLATYRKAAFEVFT